MARRSFVQPSLSRVGRLFDGRDGEASSECHLPVGANQTVCSCHICRAGAAGLPGCRSCSLALGYSIISLVAVKSICITHVELRGVEVSVSTSAFTRCARCGVRSRHSCPMQPALMTASAIVILLGLARRTARDRSRKHHDLTCGLRQQPASPNTAGRRRTWNGSNQRILRSCFCFPWGPCLGGTDRR